MQRFAALALLFVLPALSVAQDMPLSQVLIDGKGWQLAAKDFKGITGLAFDRAGDVYVADPGQGVRRVRPDGSVHPTIAPKSTGAVAVAPSAVVAGHEALLTWAERDGKKLIEAYTPANDAKGGVSHAVHEDVTLHSFVVARNGAVYYTVPDEQAVYGVSAGKKRKVAEGIGRPTGLVFWPDQGTLVVADAAGKHLYAFRVEKDGSLSNKEGYYTLRLPAGKKESGAAGMCVDAAGRLYVATTVGVQCFDPTGRLNGVLLNPTTTPPTAVTFGGPNFDLLYVACGDRLFARETKAQGFVPPKK